MTQLANTAFDYFPQLPAASRLALELLTHPASLQFPASAVTALDAIARRSSQGLSEIEDQLLSACRSAILEAEMRA
jgi:hypothetical protein